jgi:simple sugar transport system ATP-binding protein
VTHTRPQPVVSLREITKAFPGVVANDRISLDLFPGEVHCVLGENGAGKSTLISILAGMQLQDSGDIVVDGTVTQIGSPRMAMRLGIGVVHQHSTLVPSLTVLENLMLGGRTLRLNIKQATQRLSELSETLGLTFDPATRAQDLGFGQLQEVEIAKAMWSGSRVLILDEPTSMLVPSAIERLAQNIERLRSTGLAVVFITHKLREAYQLGNRVTVLKNGRVVGHIDDARLKTLSEAQAQSEILSAMFGEDQGNIGTVAESESDADLAGATDARRLSPAADLTAQPLVFALRSASSSGIDRDVEIEDTSLELRSGEILGIAGMDGHGQVALAEVVAGQRGLKSGSITLGSEDISALDVRDRQLRGVRYVTDDRLHEGIIGGFSIAINLVLKRIGQAPFWRFGQLDRAAVNAEAERLIAEYEIRPPNPAARAGTLSGGNIQKLLLARELGNGARVVVINKPTYGLDLRTVRRVHTLLREFAASGGAVLMISTELDELIELSHRIAVMSHGQIVGIAENTGRATAEHVGRLMTAGSDQE